MKFEGRGGKERTTDLGIMSRGPDSIRHRDIGCFSIKHSTKENMPLRQRQVTKEVHNIAGEMMTLLRFLLYCFASL